MSRLPRPSIPTSTKLRIALRQLGYNQTTIDEAILAMAKDRILGEQLKHNLARLADQLQCEVSDLRLDHDPALENREKFVELETGKRSWVMVVPKGADVIRYSPDANDPEHLFYRPHGTQFVGSHDAKTRIRGDRGQLSDNALAKKERRRLRKLDPKRQHSKIKSRGFQTGQKRKWPSRSF